MMNGKRLTPEVMEANRRFPWHGRLQFVNIK